LSPLDASRRLAPLKMSPSAATVRAATAQRRTAAR
jgi:hypothetical protein